ncbi:hypothetical protein MIMGU_mgv1a018472mg [Erythranthe guttata]|uniref:Uncharacterized protein n=1 Tax=Erythranthe guttata TaxID=4155 RepID=A0A022RMT0_ERYGU|nr:hypothetical protein MIMGU_mgv1a018472mg [Erythranthe guttata]
MAEAVVSTIRNLLVEEARFYSSVKSEVEAIHPVLQLMRSFLQKRSRREIEQLGVGKPRSPGSPRACMHTFGMNPIIESSGEGTDFRRRARILDLRRSYSHVVDEDFVGLEGDVNMLAAHLIDDGQRDRVVSIYGMGGLGKTTIARKVYTHGDVRRHFDVFAWSCISQQWDKKDVLQEILIKLIPEKRGEILGMRDEELVKELHCVQLKNKCLVVLDDIWSGQDWERLQPAFPTTMTTRAAGSKILLTTRNRQVPDLANPSGFLYEPRFLSIEESWELLRRKAFPKSEDNIKIIRYDLVYDNITWYLARGRGNGQQQAVNGVLAFSYHDLPYKFKQPFLYLANFPEDFEIEAEKLYQFWLAEGFISRDDRAEEETMVDVAERYLAELAQRSMVQVNVKETAGGFKSCRLHDLMRDLCISKAKEENFAKVVDFRHESSSTNNTTATTMRRISVYLGRSNIANSDPVAACSEYRHIRSAFFYANDLTVDFMQRTKVHFSNLELLRVLNLQGFRYQLPKTIGDLIHLRHLSLSFSHFKKLPPSLGKLIFLQTLDLEVDNELEVPNVIWKLARLEHLYLPAKFQTHDSKKLRLDGLSELEILVNFNTRFCDVRDLDTLTNLRKLRAAINDELNDLPNIIKYISFTQNHLRRSSLSISCPQFCSDEELSLLRTLLGCHRLYKLSINRRISKLPEHYHFSSSIAKITFKASALDKDPMATPEKLSRLSSLRLYGSSYVEEDMVCSTDGFPRLLYLKLWDLPNLKRWRIEQGAMPKLTRLVIAHCRQLEMLPEGLKFISTLQKLNARWMPDLFKDRLRAADARGEYFYKVRHVPDVKLD